MDILHFVARVLVTPTDAPHRERLDSQSVPYRYHLARGIERIIEWLWNVELHGRAARDVHG